MNLLHINDSLERGGAETLLVNTVQAIDKYLPHIKQTVVTLYDSGELVNDIKGIADYYTLNYSLKNSIQAIIKLKKILSRQHINVIHSHLLHSTFLARLAVNSKTKLVSTYHSVFYDPAMVTYAKKELLIDRLTYRDKYFSIFVSEAVRENITMHVRIEKNYEVLLNFASSQFFPSYCFRNEPELRVVMVGNLHEIKNHKIAIRAMGELKHLPIFLDIYGDGHLRDKLQKLINESGANVSLKGKEKMSSAILAQYDLYLMTSQHEGMPLSLIEALQTGLPSLLNEISMLKETAGNAAVYYDYDSLESLKDKLQSLLNERTLLNELAINAVKQSKKFSAETTVQKLFTIYSKTIE
jgi:glycosyltransferase involved in cell wall biosynthesis